MKYRKHILTSISLALLCLATSSAIAQSFPTSTLTVTATVISNCSITTTPVAFPKYDPTSTLKPSFQLGSISIVCTPGMNSTKILLGKGNGGVSCPTTTTGQTTRCMTGGTTKTSKLSYELYQPTGTTGCGTPPGTKVWNDTDSVLSVGGSTDLAPRTYNVCGYLPESQPVIAQEYSDTVVVTVSF